MDMLHSQIPSTRLKKIVSDLEINAGIVKAKVQGELTLGSRISRLRVVEQHLRALDKVGSVSDPKSYFSGYLNMKWGYYGDDRFMYDKEYNPPLVYFGGTVGNTVLGLGGSSKHVIGSVGESWAHAASGTPFIVAQLLNEVGAERRDEVAQKMNLRPGAPESEGFDDLALRAVELASTQMSGPEHRMEFLAKRLIHGNESRRFGYKYQNVMLGTPLYVAISE